MKRIWENNEYRKRMSDKHKGQHNSPKTEFIKGRVAWNKGKAWSEDIKQKMSLAKKGKLCGSQNPFFGKKHSEETKRKWSIIRIGRSGSKAGNWKGGISFLSYPQEFNEELKERIRNRDNRTCQRCGKTEAEQMKTLKERISVNHIDHNKRNNEENNLNVLCRSCNAAVNKNPEYWIEYFQQYQTCCP